jgi:hypothetical protein
MDANYNTHSNTSTSAGDGDGTLQWGLHPFFKAPHHLQCAVCREFFCHLINTGFTAATLVELLASIPSPYTPRDSFNHPSRDSLSRSSRDSFDHPPRDSLNRSSRDSHNLSYHDSSFRVRPHRDHSPRVSPIGRSSRMSPPTRSHSHASSDDSLARTRPTVPSRAFEHSRNASPPQTAQPPSPIVEKKPEKPTTTREPKTTRLVTPLIDGKVDQYPPAVHIAEDGHLHPYPPYPIFALHGFPLQELDTDRFRYWVKIARSVAPHLRSPSQRSIMSADSTRPPEYSKKGRVRATKANITVELDDAPTASHSLPQPVDKAAPPSTIAVSAPPPVAALVTSQEAPMAPVPEDTSTLLSDVAMAELEADSDHPADFSSLLDQPTERFEWGNEPCVKGSLLVPIII